MACTIVRRFAIGPADASRLALANGDLCTMEGKELRMALLGHCLAVMQLPHAP